ncbi:MAG: hypothetical protein ABIG42_08870 [bacterium]
MRTFIFFIIFLPVLAFSACSSNSAVTPSDSPNPSDEMIAKNLGNFGLQFDPETGDIEILYDRGSSVHYEVTTYLNPPACGGSGCISATLNSWNPVTLVASFSVSITNPTAWTPSDTRMIFYNLGGRKIVNADSFTRAFVGTIEPFIAFGKANPNRTLPGGGTATETVDIYWPPMSPFTIWFRVSTWLWLNCQDPYEINSQFQTGTLKPSSGSAVIGCTVLDWQNNVTGVKIDTTPITGGVTPLAFLAGIWQATITNSMGAGPGTYPSLITASSPNPQNFDLYNYLNVVVVPNGWTNGGSWNLPQGPCSLDFGVQAAAGGGNPIITRPAAVGGCNQIWMYPGGWGNPPFLYASLVNLDPTDPSFQPWDVDRLDASNDGAFGWTNTNRGVWNPNFPIINSDTYCNFDNIPNFIWIPEADDHRHYMFWMQELPLHPVDVCDTFKLDQCALYVDTGHGVVGFQGLPGASFGFDYTDADMIWEAIWPPALVGFEPGQVDPADVSAIDAMRMEDRVIWVYIAQKSNQRVEVFKITDIGPGPVDIVGHVMTIPVIHGSGIAADPKDIELLPGHGGYAKAPGIPILNVLIDNGASPFPPPGFGGSVWIYNALTGVFVDQIGNNVSPAVRNTPVYLDTDDIEYSVHIMQVGPTVDKFNYF